MKTTFIYFLKDPEDSMKGYVGKSNNPKGRFPKHLTEIKNKTHYRANWIKSLIFRGLTPALEILDEVPFEHWPQLEVAYIEFFLEQGFNLVNGTPGGEDPPSSKGRKMSSEHRAKLLALSIGKIVSKETREKQSAAKKANPNSGTFKVGHKHSSETIAKISVTKKGKEFSNSGTFKPGHKASPETLAKISAANKGKKRPIEVGAKISAAKKGKGKPWSPLRWNRFAQRLKAKNLQKEILI